MKSMKNILVTKFKGAIMVQPMFKYGNMQLSCISNKYEASEIRKIGQSFPTFEIFSIVHLLLDDTTSFLYKKTYLGKLCIYQSLL